MRIGGVVLSQTSIKAGNTTFNSYLATAFFSETAADTGGYVAKTGQVELFASGADIGVKAAGGTVPAFDKKLVAPSLVTVTSPAWPAAGTPYDLDRTKPISLVWTGGTAGDVTASVTTFATGQTALISCKFKAADGKGTVPASALGKLVVTTQGSISVGASSSLAFDQGDWKMTLSASSPAKAGASLASGAAKVH